MYLETIKKSLYPRLENILRWKNENEINAIKSSFYSHCEIIDRYFTDNDLENITLNFFIDLHKILYPNWYKIKATGNDWINHIMLPWDFRKQYLSKYITTFSNIEDIKNDLWKTIEEFNKIKVKKRENILKFFLDFWKIHPFGDSNGTISCLFCDVICKKNNLKPLNTLNIRFKNKEYWFLCLKEYEKNKDLKQVLKMFDNFNDGMI